MSEMSELSNEEIAAAVRFHETVTDDGTYDISVEMRSKLQAKKFIKHVGGGRYMETNLLLDLIESY